MFGCENRFAGRGVLPASSPARDHGELVLVEQRLQRRAGGMEAVGHAEVGRLDRMQLALRDVERRRGRAHGGVALVARRVVADQHVLAVVAALLEDAHERAVAGRRLRADAIALREAAETARDHRLQQAAADRRGDRPVPHFCTW
jgi:hypothetical protein